jgi:hypothetical protein
MVIFGVSFRCLVWYGTRRRRRKAPLDRPLRIPWRDKSVDHVLGTESLSDASRAAILGENAAKLLGI